MKQKNTNFKTYYYIWGVALLALMIASVVLKEQSSLLPVVAIVLFGGAVVLRKMKNSVTEIEIENGVAYFHMYDGKVKAVYVDAIEQIRETNAGPVVVIGDKEEVTMRKGFIVKTDESVVTELRQEDFPRAQFVRMKKIVCQKSARYV